MSLGTAGPTRRAERCGARRQRVLAALTSPSCQGGRQPARLPRSPPGWTPRPTSPSPATSVTGPSCPTPICSSPTPASGRWAPRWPTACRWWRCRSTASSPQRPRPRPYGRRCHPGAGRPRRRGPQRPRPVNAAARRHRGSPSAPAPRSRARVLWPTPTDFFAVLVAPATGTSKSRKDATPGAPDMTSTAPTGSVTYIVFTGAPPSPMPSCTLPRRRVDRAPAASAAAAIAPRSSTSSARKHRWVTPRQCPSAAEPRRPAPRARPVGQLEPHPVAGLLRDRNRPSIAVDAAPRGPAPA